MQTMEEMVKTYYKENNKFTHLDKKIYRIEKKIQKLASKGKLYYEMGCFIRNMDVLEKIASAFQKLGYSTCVDRWNGGICIRWKKPEEIK